MSAVCLASRERIWGGGEVFLLEIGLDLAQRGHEVLWRVEPDSELAERIHPQEPISRRRRVRADVVVANDFRSLWQSLLLDGRAVDRRLVLHGAWQISPVRARILTAARVRCYAVSEAVVAAARASGYRGELPVLPLGPGRTAEGSARRSAPVLDHATIGMIGRWDPVKRVELFCQVVTSLGRPGVILAPEPTTDVERALALRASAYPSVEVVHEHGAFWSRCDVLLSTSRAESLGLAHLEGLAQGVPVVSTAVGGPGDFLTGTLALGHLTGTPDHQLADATRRAVAAVSDHWDAYSREARQALAGRGSAACSAMLLGGPS